MIYPEGHDMGDLTRMRESVPKGHDITGCVDRMRAEYTAKWGVQLAGMIFQTRSGILPDMSLSKYCVLPVNVCEAGFE